MTKVLVDTSIIIDYLRRRDKNQTILYNLGRNKHELYASVLTHTESYAGKSIWQRKEAKIALGILLSGIKILPLQENVSRKAGEISAKYDIDIVDAIIAATAISNKLELATLNVKDFKKIEKIIFFNSPVSKS